MVMVRQSARAPHPRGGTDVAHYTLIAISDGDTENITDFTVLMICVCASAFAVLS